MSSERQTEFEFQPVWQQVDAGVRDEVIALWRRHNALPSPDEAQQRVSELCCVARHEGEVVAVSTARLVQVEQVRAPLYYYRCFVVPECREQTLAARITVESRDILERYARDNPDAEGTGMVAVIESQALRAVAHRPVWRRSRLALIGYDANGQQIRVYWFEDAKLPLPPGY